MVQSAFAGRSVVIFSGEDKKDDENAFFEATNAIRDDGGFGSIIGRNAFQREKADALRMLDGMVKIYAKGGERQKIIG
jgi:class I fructose-bisphosphate aldolase